MYSRTELYLDSQSVLRTPGEYFYDGEGVLRSRRDLHCDYQGILRGPGDLFYDGEGVLALRLGSGCAP